MEAKLRFSYWSDMENNGLLIYRWCTQFKYLCCVFWDDGKFNRCFDKKNEWLQRDGTIESVCIQ